ncbi:MAG TPA: class II fructose-bisphosphatase [archaeon]|nr:class II fructose-bisphosphatase [archaeon]
MDKNLALDFVRATEHASIAAAKWIGKGDNNAADDAAVKEMRDRFNKIDFRGRIVIGEGERDEAPMLFIGEEVGTKNGLEVDIAVDPLEGTNLTAKGLNGALSVLAAAPKGNLLHAPDTYMDKIAVGEKARGKVSLDKSVEDNIQSVADALDKDVTDVGVIILERDRHNELIKKVRNTGARVHLISDGDVAAAIATTISDSSIDILLGMGGAPEGVIAAAALKCLGGDFQGRLKFRNDEEKERGKKMGVDEKRLLKMDDLAKGDDVVFVATGVTNGNILKGVRFLQDKTYTNSVIMRSKSKTIRFIESFHKEKK